MCLYIYYRYVYIYTVYTHVCIHLLYKWCIAKFKNTKYIKRWEKILGRYL